ncbi:unnamed protein product, partial [Musa textilis]
GLNRGGGDRGRRPHLGQLQELGLRTPWATRLSDGGGCSSSPPHGAAIGARCCDEDRATAPPLCSSFGTENDCGDGRAQAESALLAWDQGLHWF